jgi:alpha-galactosidase
VATLRLKSNGGMLELWADGAVDELQAGDLDGALVAVGGRLGVRQVTAIPPGWCSWSCYFSRVTEQDVYENVDAAVRRSVPIAIVQIDHGYETDIGDWLDTAPGFGSLQRVAQRIRSASMQPGIWSAPFLVGPSSSVAMRHPDWLVRDADAGLHWNQRMRILDVTHPAAAEHLAGVYRTLSDWGFSYHKVDFLYAGAIEGRRHSDCSGLDAYREGLRLVRAAIGPDALLLACGAPVLPSIGLCDAMRVGPDVLPEGRGQEPDLESLFRITKIRSWMNGRFWVNDPDCLVARPEIVEREALASFLEGYGGVAFSSDRLAALDERGLELTRRVLDRAQLKS